MSNLQDSEFFNWLAGFIDGEGNFGIDYNAAQKRYHCTFSLTLRSDDHRILIEIKERTKIGRLRFIYKTQNRKHGFLSKPQLSWVVKSKIECMALINILDKHPLRAKKAADFGIWRQAIMAWTAKVQVGRGIFRNDWGDMAALKASLEELHIYRNDHEETLLALVKDEQIKRASAPQQRFNKLLSLCEEIEL